MSKTFVEGFKDGSKNNNWFFGVMFLIFMTLKLTGHITWSWWWVTAPLWGPIVLALLILGVFYAIYIPYTWIRG